FSSRRRHTRFSRDWSSDVCSSDLRYRVLLATQIASLGQALLLAVLVYNGDYALWHILLLTVALGAINAFDVPARQALVYEMVNKIEHLPNAIALNSSMVNVARLVGPALSGIVLSEFGAEVCFFANALSFVAVIASLLMMHMSPFVPKKRETSV